MRAQDYARLESTADTLIETKKLKKKLEDERGTLTREQEEVTSLRGTILRQLRIIERMLEDPSSIERIEPYDNPFASGNFEMLKRIALAVHRHAKAG